MNARRWLLLVSLTALLIVAGHVALLSYASDHLRLTATTVAGVAALLVIKALALRRWHRASRTRGERSST